MDLIFDSISVHSWIIQSFHTGRVLDLICFNGHLVH